MQLIDGTTAMITVENEQKLQKNQTKWTRSYLDSARCKLKMAQYEEDDPYILIPEKDSEWDDENEKHLIEYTTNRSSDTSSREIFCKTTVRRTKSGVYNKPNRTVVVIMGSLRGGEPAWESLYRNVLDVNNADLALIIGRHRDDTTNNSTYPHNSTLYHRAKYIWMYHEEYDSINNFWSNTIDEMVRDDPLLQNDTDAINWRTTIMNYTIPDRGLFGPIKVIDPTNGTVYERQGSGAIIFIFRVWLSQKIQQHNLQKKYYRFIITRADHYYLCPHNIDTFLPALPLVSSPSSSTPEQTKSTTKNRKKFIWTPNGGSDYGGITDRYLVVTNRYVLDALNIFPAFFDSYLHYKSLPRQLRMNPERVIHYIWSSYMCYIPNYNDRFNRTMLTVGSDGDTTRWQSYGDTVNVSYLLQRSSVLNNVRRDTESRSVRLKYQSEYSESISNCNLH